MRLKEYEAKRILRENGIETPDGEVVTSPEERSRQSGVVKIQRLRGGRKKDDGIRFTDSGEETQTAIRELLQRSDTDEVLIEECLDGEEYYIGFTFDTRRRAPVMILSTHGGVDIEDWRDTEAIVTRTIDPVDGLEPWMVREACYDAGIERIHRMASFAVDLYDVFRNLQIRTLEINPAMMTDDGLLAADALVVVDDDGTHDLDLPERVGLRERTERERKARAIDDSTHRGVAGKTYLELDGDIAVLASGGGASVTAMDAILTYGGSLANYTEYSGNPPPDKVRELADLVLEQDGLSGCFIVGGRANFTRIDDTLEAIFDVLTSRGADYPVVVRRAGPGDEKGFAIARRASEQADLDVTLYDDTTSISKAAKDIVRKAERYDGDTR